jgi:hypothetical protein
MLFLAKSRQADRSARRLQDWCMLRLAGRANDPLLDIK